MQYQNKDDNDYWDTVIIITVMGVFLIGLFLITNDMDADTRRIKNTAPTIVPSLPGEPLPLPVPENFPEPPPSLPQ
jgi:hypothetical protein